MFVIEPRLIYNEANQQLLVKKTYMLVADVGYVKQTEEEIWSDEHTTSEVWGDLPEEITPVGE